MVSRITSVVWVSPQELLLKPALKPGWDFAVAKR